MKKDMLEHTVQLLRDSKHVVALTGAGISTPSGIPDFRSSHSGLWEHFDPTQVASIIGFKKAPQHFFRWIAPLAKIFAEAQPNPAHIALARLEALGKLRSIITQNVDTLHKRAGSQTVYEVHGHMREATCITCFSIFPSEPLLQDLIDGKDLLLCESCGGVLKPNVILFGEQLPMPILEAAQRHTRQCDLMIVAGSSLEVYPVADLPRKAIENGAKLIIINDEPTPYDSDAVVVIRQDVAQALPQIVKTFEKHV